MTLHTLFALHTHFFSFVLLMRLLMKFCILIVYENMKTSMKTIDK